MFEIANLDEREQLIFQDADQFWATRFMGSGRYDRLGPFPTQEEAVKAIFEFFQKEDRGEYPITSLIAGKPFTVYALATKHAQGQMVLGNLYRDGIKRLTNKEVSLKRKEERERANPKPSRRRNPARSSTV